jgi:hypothetical protein
MFLVLFIVNTAVTFLLFWLMRRFYAARFDRFAVIVQEAMALRDAQIAKFEAQFADALIKDTKIIDDLLDDYSDIVDTEIKEEGEADEREGEDS